ncbi:DNA cytosine methyltransferase [Arcobacter cryaerophilus gv. pseudocryaerophilus]|uniref:Cytosine-specific methyltransferase n=3 Tax=unclassified Arcobacter TaxID=2593671 RepID=A0AA96IEH4_9BACT|nr:DNA cytosine methyltransferase [Arcobacter sp. AZ-2023]WPD05513.1 DNA cytosine methyltransferase [Arcobacter sp. DSM 115956]WPD07605.1 DNA cytosine methyltransferase [Arcobacter sp. DSM 115955]WNL31871.1 DNA cytosine methyltransferase [Arcobacter sp. AZ-2023]WNP38021.1 DNA cytosine methyltransferase [Arcobacter sp. AZ-2023]
MKVISLFSGAGGMDLGFVESGFEIVWANDFDLDATRTYSHNIGNHIVHGDITKIKSEDIPYGKGEIDVIIGGFPCQGFSVANNKRSIEDERNFLYREMLRVIKDKEPKYFVAENVKGILSLHHGKVFELIKSDFKELGYNLEARLLNSADYGVPQQRERVIIIGNRINKPIIFPKQTHIHHEKYDGKGNKHIAAKEVLEELYHIETVERNTDQRIKLKTKDIYNHIAYTNVSSKFWGRKHKVDQAEICDYLKHWRNKKGLSTKKIDEHFGYAHTAGHWFRKDNKSGSIPKPSDWWELKKLLGFCNKYDKQVTEFVEKEIKFEQSLRISNWETPSDTITASTPEIHPNKHRRLSVRECARIQTFPDNFVFLGSLSSQHRQVGNAVPPLLAKLVAKEIKKGLLEK